MAFFESEKTGDTPEEESGGEGVSSATTDLDQKYLLQNQSQRHQYFITREPAGRRTHTPPPPQPFLFCPFLSSATILSSYRTTAIHGCWCIM